MTAKWPGSRAMLVAALMVGVPVFQACREASTVPEQLLGPAGPRRMMADDGGCYDGGDGSYDDNGNYYSCDDGGGDGGSGDGGWGDGGWGDGGSGDGGWGTGDGGYCSDITCDPGSDGTGDPGYDPSYDPGDPGDGWDANWQDVDDGDDPNGAECQADGWGDEPLCPQMQCQDESTDVYKVEQLPQTATESDFGSVLNSLTSSCPRTSFESICIDLWISQATAGPLTGDNRGPDPDAADGRSRVTVVIDVRTMTVADVKPSVTCVHDEQHCVRPLPVQMSAPNWWDSYSHVLAGSDGQTLSLQMQLKNGTGTGPSIDGGVSLTHNGDGSFDVSYVRNAFPSIAIYHWTGSSWDQLHVKEESDWHALFDLLNKVDQWCSGSTTPVTP